MLFKVVEKFYRKMLYTRADDTGAVFYFSADDFVGLNQKSYTVPSCDGHNLQGYFYYYDNPIKNRIIVFEHGMGSGHRGYMREIEVLCRHGYLVFAYDHTGCMESGGETTGGFVQSLKDCNDVIGNLKKIPELKDYGISVVGHSWGGFSTLNICALHPDIVSIVALAGFISVKDVLGQFFSGPLSPFFNRIYRKESDANPDFIKYNAVESLTNSDVTALIIHSEDDKTLNCKKHFDVMKKELADKKNINFLKVTGKNHNPNYTADAVKYLGEFLKARMRAEKNKKLTTAEQKKAFINSFDWNKMTQQDETIWAEIFKTLDK